jgi:hypothetical protein
LEGEQIFLLSISVLNLLNVVVRARDDDGRCITTSPDKPKKGRKKRRANRTRNTV